MGELSLSGLCLSSCPGRIFKFGPSWGLVGGGRCESTRLPGAYEFKLWPGVFSK